MTKTLIILGAVAAVAAPILVHIINVSWESSSLLINLFPVFGLLAFGLLWLHAVSGVFEDELRRMFDFEAFVRWTALVILVSMLLHPLILLVLIRFDVLALFAPGEHQLALLLGLAALVLLLTYDIGKLMRKHEFVERNWRAILVVSNAGFVLAFFHSLLIGSDLQTGFMRKLWLFYGASAILALVYTYALKPVIKPSGRRQGRESEIRE